MTKPKSYIKVILWFVSTIALVWSWSYLDHILKDSWMRFPVASTGAILLVIVIGWISHIIVYDIGGGEL